MKLKDSLRNRRHSCSGVWLYKYPKVRAAFEEARYLKKKKKREKNCEICEGSSSIFSFKVSTLSGGEIGEKERKIKCLESVHEARRPARKSGRDNPAKMLRNDPLCSVEHNKTTIRHLHPGFKDSSSSKDRRGRKAAFTRSFWLFERKNLAILSHLLATKEKKKKIGCNSLFLADHFVLRFSINFRDEKISAIKLSRTIKTRF